MNRTSFTKYSPGATTTATIAPAWLAIHARSAGAPAVVARGGVATGVTGQVQVTRWADVMVGDILLETSTGRAFSVVQIYKQPAYIQALVSEIFPPIPDEFESGI